MKRIMELMSPPEDAEGNPIRTDTTRIERKLYVYALCLYPHFDEDILRCDEFGRRTPCERESLVRNIIREYGSLSAMPPELKEDIRAVDNAFLKHIDLFYECARCKDGGVIRKRDSDYRPDIPKTHWWYWPDLIYKKKLRINLKAGDVFQKKFGRWFKVGNDMEIEPYVFDPDGMPED